MKDFEEWQSGTKVYKESQNAGSQLSEKMASLTAFQIRDALNERHALLPLLRRALLILGEGKIKTLIAKAYECFEAKEFPRKDTGEDRSVGGYFLLLLKSLPEKEHIFKRRRKGKSPRFPGKKRFRKWKQF